MENGVQRPQPLMAPNGLPIIFAVTMGPQGPGWVCADNLPKRAILAALTACIEQIREMAYAEPKPEPSAIVVPRLA